MKEIRYRTKVERRGGTWHVSVPALPRDAPVVKTDKLANAAPILIEELSHYLGVSVNMISIDVEAPTRPARPRLRDRLTASAVQAAGGVGALTGMYLVAGYAVTLITASVAAVVLGALREAGKV